MEPTSEEVPHTANTPSIKKSKGNSASKKQSLSLNDNTIFIRNISFSTTEEKMKILFSNYLPEEEIAFCLIVKDKETKLSKGSAFLKLKSNQSFEKIMAMYHDYNNKRSSSDMNPFELDGRNLKLFKAMSRDELKASTEQNEESLSNRKKEYLYFGLSNESISEMPLYEEITETDKAKRERLIKIKKANFQQNPNYHVSLTRLSLRNFDKTVKEEHIKEMIMKTVEEDKDLKKKYKNVKMVKQIKLLKENDGENEKSKCVAFVECCSFDFAKKIIDKLSGYKMTVKTRKGLIIDFSLDDFRKRTARLKKLERIREIRKEKRKEIVKGNKNRDKEKIEIGKVNDIDKLISLYQMTFSRGKKQRIKKKLKTLGYDKPIASLEKRNINNENNDKEMIPKEEYVKVKISNSRTEMNKKMKDKRKENKYKAEDKILLKKRGRNKDKEKNAEENEDVDINKIIKRRKGFRVEKKNKKKVMFDQNNDIDIDDVDDNMKGYYSKIIANLNTNK